MSPEQTEMLPLPLMMGRIWCSPLSASTLLPAKGISLQRTGTNVCVLEVKLGMLLLFSWTAAATYYVFGLLFILDPYNTG